MIHACAYHTTFHPLEVISAMTFYKFAGNWSCWAPMVNLGRKAFFLFYLFIFIFIFSKLYDWLIKSVMDYAARSTGCYRNPEFV